MITTALGIRPGECIAVVGAGGKTSLCWLLTQELAARSERVIFTTTTRIRRPRPQAFDRIVVSDSLLGDSLLGDSNWRTACIAAAIDGVPDDTPLAESLMPVYHTKLIGFSDAQICNLQPSISGTQSPITLVVEADGARGMMLKAPAAYEPVIPVCATTVCVVANLDVIGQPLDERAVHRPERVAQLTGMRLGDPIGVEAMAALLAHPDGGMKGIPEGARPIAVLMQRDEYTAHPDVASMVDALRTAGYDQVIVLSPRADPPRLLFLTV